MPTVLKMRAARVAKYDSGGQDINEVQLVTTDRDNQALEPDTILSATLTASFKAPAGDELVHDQLYDVTLSPVV